MSNRRRSERFEIALPVWLKDAKGGERTSTVDVSAHGIAVLAGHDRPLRQYVELELELDVPAQTISVTAVVARHAALVRRDTGEPVHGLGLDFFLFDARAKAGWNEFIQGLKGRARPAEPRPATKRPPPPPPPEPTEEPEDDTPTFIIKPRDLGRLWAFFRGEMARGVVRIETPVLKPVGHPAELLVVHPTSQAEWSLEGSVVTATAHGRGGRPVLEIGLNRLLADDKAAFRSFVATGRGQVEEEVSLDVDEPSSAELEAPEDEPERIESVVIDLDALDDAFGSGFEEPKLLTHPPQPPSPGEVEADEDPTQHTRSPLPSGVTPAAEPVSARVEAEERPTSVFASFFDEARAAGGPAVEPSVDDEVGFDSPESTDEAEVDLSAASRARSQVQRVMPVDAEEPEPEPIPLVRRIDRPRSGPPPLPRAVPPPLPPPDPIRAGAPSPAHDPRPAAPRRAVPPLPPSARQRSSARRRPSDDPSVQVRPVAPPPVPLVEGQRASEEAAPRAPANDALMQNPPVPPGSVFDWGDPSRRIPVPPEPAPAPRAAPPPAPRGTPPRPKLRRGARRVAADEQEHANHRAVFTESSDPDLARDIALARARVVRSPHSVTACYRLSTLLLKSSEDEAGLDEAVRALDKVTALEPNHPGAHHKLAELYARRGDYARAAEHLGRARRLGYQVDPDLEHIIGEANRAE